MSDALPLPPRPNLDQYRKLAKELQSACRSGEPDAVRNWAIQWVERMARLQGLEIALQVRGQINDTASGIEHRWHKSTAKERGSRCTLADAQLFVAREHGFASWPKFAGHLAGLALAHSPVSQFEAAADAIVSGDATTLAAILNRNPELVEARSTRDHRSTLLHYVSANGVENFRQKTPKNILEITKLLLQAGAAVNAESDAYGGRSTTLGLTATSWHPENAGVQLPLLQLLIDHGALLDGPDGASAVNSCLANGRGPAAEFLAARGAKLDLEGAAGVGRPDVVQTFFSDDGRVKPPATEKQMQDGFAWACEFGRTSVVDFLLQRGMTVESKLRHNRQTGLHWAAYGGHVNTVKLLLRHGSRVDATDESYGGTPLDWALYAWADRNEAEKPERGSYYAVVAALVRAGAKPESKPDSDNPGAPRTAKKIQADPRMLAALRGEDPAE
jgi:ankyrin repeat protein